MHVQPYTLPANLPKKTPEELAHIAETVKANFLFAHLNQQQRHTIFEAMEKILVTPGEVNLHLQTASCPYTQECASLAGDEHDELRFRLDALR